MKKPEKKTSAYQHQITLCKCNQCYEAYIYNQGRQDMIDFLPSEEEIHDILFEKLYSNETDKYLEIKDKLADSYDGVAGYTQVCDLLSKAISKRIGK